MLLTLLSTIGKSTEAQHIQIDSLKKRIQLLEHKLQETNQHISTIESNMEFKVERESFLQQQSDFLDSRTELLHFEDKFNELMSWIYVLIAAAFILGFFELHLWRKVTTNHSNVEQKSKEVNNLIESVNAQQVELNNLISSLDNLKKKVTSRLDKNKEELIGIINAKDKALRRMFREGEATYEALTAGKILVLCRDEHDESHMRELMTEWEFPQENVTYTPLDAKAEGKFDLVVLDDHDKENIPDELLVNCFDSYPKSYFVFYVNNPIDRNIIPEDIRYNFANSHETLLTRIMDALKDAVK